MPVPSLRSRLNAHAWWLLLVAALAWFGLGTHRRLERIEAVSALPTWSVDAPARAAASPTGYQAGQRHLIVVGQHHPSFRWIREAQDAAASGQLRLRHIHYDAQPDGREIRRTAPYRGWLISVGWVRAKLWGEPLGYALERAALWADPLLFMLMLTASTLWVARVLGPTAAAGWGVGATSLFPLAANFIPGAPDPHSLAWVLALGSVLPLLAGRLGLHPARKFHFVLAGVLGGLGFWNDAGTQTVVLLLVGLGALAGGLIGAPAAGAVPVPWRTWALAGALTTLAASGFEAAPDFFTWSPGLIHPVHAIAWWGLGEILVLATRWPREGGALFKPAGLARLALAVGAVSAWPVVALTAGPASLLAPDFHAQQLAILPRGILAPGLGAWLGAGGDAGAKWGTLLPAVLATALLALAVLTRAGRGPLAWIAFLLVGLLGTAALACLQLRWWNLFDVFVLVTLAALLAGAESGVWPRWPARLALLAVLPGLIAGYSPPFKADALAELTEPEAQALIARDYAYWTVLRSHPQPVVLFSTPLFAEAAAYYGGFKTVVSSDDTNRTGYLAAVRLASAVTEQEAAVLVNTQGLTHVALPHWDPVMDHLVRFGSLTPADQPLPPNAFAVSLRDWGIPLWMRPMDYLIPSEPRFLGYTLQAFAMQPEQEADLGLSRLADFFVDRGQLKEARSVCESLEQYPRSIPALAARASVAFATRDAARLKTAQEALLPLLSRRAARDLPADRRVSLAGLLLRTKHPDLAAEQLAACQQSLDDATLRTFHPGTVVSLWELSHTLKRPFRDPSLEALAWQLIPPSVRSGLTR